MNYSFEYKNLGSITQQLLEKLKVFALTRTYSIRYNWVVADAGILTDKECLIQETIEEIKKFVNVGNLVDATINILPSMSYIPEHSDLIIPHTIKTYHKIHIPLITNKAVGMIWPGSDKGKLPSVINMKEGNIYLYNNIAKHCAVNLSDTSRYHLVLEFDNIICVE